MLFAEAGLEKANFKFVESRWMPPTGYDRRAAWEGIFPQQPQLLLRLEASAYRGRPVWFEMIGPWTETLRRTPVLQDLNVPPTFPLALLVMISIGALLARRNLRLGRGDRKGAFLLALIVISVYLLS